MKRDENKTDPASAQPQADASGGETIFHPVRGETIPLPPWIPLIATPDVVAFRESPVRISVRTDQARRVMHYGLTGDELVAVVLQKNPLIDAPGKDDLHSVAMLGILIKVLPESEQNLSVMFNGIERVVITGDITTSPMLGAAMHLMPDVAGGSPEQLESLSDAVRTAAARLIEISPDIPPEAAGMLDEAQTPTALADFLAERLDQPAELKQQLLAQANVLERLEEIGRQIAKRIEMMDIINKIRGDARSRIDDQQKRYFLREQIESIQKELGGEDPETRDAARLRQRLDAAGLPAPVKEETDRELERLAGIPQASPEYSLIRGYLETVASLPWSVETPDNFDIKRAKAILEEDHYDLEKIKRRIIEFLAVRRLNPSGRGSILCFVGPPGVGKTSLGKSIARALGRKFVRLSLGGVRDEADIRGHRRTYVGAFPGRIIEGLRKCGSRNPIMMLDEIDKLSSDFRGDPASALLEVLDPEQNHTFQDHYLSLPFDLSRAIFICTANSIEPIPYALKDRLEIIEIPGYTLTDKLQIAQRFLIPQQLAEHGLTARYCQIQTNTIRTLIESYTRESGVRALSRSIAAVMRGVAATIAEKLPAPPIPPDNAPKPQAPSEAQSAEAAAANAAPDANARPDASTVPSSSTTAAGAATQPTATGTAATASTPAGANTPAAAATEKTPSIIPPDTAQVIVRPEDLHAYLGPTAFESEVALRTASPGVATGLAYTSVGGDIMFVEASRMAGKGRLTLTGQIGRVMRESAQAALSLLKSRSPDLGIPVDAFLNVDVHVHVPAGAVPKDGPSAGVAMYTAMASLFAGVAVRPDVAMTGEITLRGLVLPIGGVREKLIAAHRAGIKMAVLPKRNQKDVAEINPPLKGMDITYVTNVDELIQLAVPLIAAKAPARKQPSTPAPEGAASPRDTASGRAGRRPLPPPLRGV